ncbi:unnamed protein product [Echinostoma caproni]|uniref:L-serine ammonia-lyase n=1 Tax=Echinostoma caproni TaxID=27848 RepID=A0A183AJD1_9TREM|nr:unnamed protein product [Echinostoma caproni]
MHASGCLSSNLSDVFPSLPLQDTIPCGQLLNVNTLNGVDVASRLKYLGLNVSSQNSNAGGVFFNEDRSRTNLIINYLPQSYDQNDLQRLFERNTGASLCYGFVDFVNPQHAALAIQTYHGYETEQKRLRVAYASSGGRRITPGTTGIYCLPPSSAELSVFRLNGYQAPDWSSPLRLRIIGSVTRESYGLFCLPSRQSPALVPSRIPNGQPAVDPLTESEALTNLLNRKALGASNCLPNALTKALDANCLAASSDLHSNTPFSLPPRAIIRNKGIDANAGLVTNGGSSHAHHLELLELLDAQAHSNAGILSSSERLLGRELPNVVANRISEQENAKSEATLRSLQQNSAAWNYPTHRSVLSTLPETTRGTDGLSQTILSGVQKRITTKTPLLPSPVLTSIVSQRGCQAHVWLKLENVQPTGSFKIRGMENVCRKWASCGVTHVVCPSGGNAAIAAACSARAYGISCTIVMPESPDSGIRRRLLLETPDAKVIVHGSDWLEAHQRAEQMVNELQVNHPGESIRLLHPYDQSELWEGYEGIIDELGPDLGQPDVIVVSVGGGGLLAGIIQGLWNRGWSSTHVVAVETEGADCLNRSMKAGQLLLLPRPTSIATSLSAPILAHRTWNLAQLQSLTPVTCTDSDAIDAVRQFLDDHGMLVEPACGASLSALYSGMIGRLQMEGRIPRPANVVVVIGGGRNVSLRQLSEWENQTNGFGSIQQVPTFLPSMTSPYLVNTSPHSVSSEMSSKSNMFTSHMPTDPDETLKCGTSTPSTPRPVCTILSRPSITAEGVDSHAPSVDGDRETSTEGPGTLNPHDLVNFSKLLATSETEGDDGTLHE